MLDLVTDVLKPRAGSDPTHNLKPPKDEIFVADKWLNIDSLPSNSLLQPKTVFVCFSVMMRRSRGSYKGPSLDRRNLDVGIQIKQVTTSVQITDTNQGSLAAIHWCLHLYRNSTRVQSVFQNLSQKAPLPNQGRCVTHALTAITHQFRHQAR